MQLQPVSQTSFELQGLRQTLPLLSAMQDQPPGQSASSEQDVQASPVPVGASHRPVSTLQTSPAGQPFSLQSDPCPSTQVPSLQDWPSAQVPQDSPQTSPQTWLMVSQVSVHVSGLPTQTCSGEQMVPASHAPQSSPQTLSQVSPSLSQV
jgi:hypothetical protein